MPIRLRILLLALVTVLGVAGGLYVQYRDIDAQISALDRRADVIRQAERVSQLVHALQKERGLSAGYMVERDARRLAPLTDQRRRTEGLLNTLSTTTPTLLEPSWTVQLGKDLAAVRRDVDDAALNWRDVRAFYTGAIRHALDSIALKNTGQDRDFSAMTNLATAREVLGLVRATVNRIYSRGEIAVADLLDVARFYGAFAENLRAFYRDLPEDERPETRARIETDVFRAVQAQVEEILGGGDGARLERSSFLWWGEATLVVDTLKAVEEQAFEELVARSRQAVEAKRAELIRYGLVAVGLVIVVGFLAVATVARILGALSVLLNTLGEVMRTQDYGIRIQAPKEGDEFGHIGLSVNRLLDYTDTLIQEKDHLASTDLLTGCRNRRSFLEAASRELERAQRYGTTASLILADIDHFKQINDTHGHGVGDETLSRFSALVAEHIRGSDILGRWGGEEFVILVPEADAEQAVTLAEKLRQAVEETAFDGVDRVTCSFGVAEREAEEKFEDLCKRADDALYEAKNKGRNRVASV